MVFFNIKQLDLAKQYHLRAIGILTEDKKSILRQYQVGNLKKFDLQNFKFQDEIDSKLFNSLKIQCLTKFIDQTEYSHFIRQDQISMENLVSKEQNAKN